MSCSSNDFVLFLFNWHLHQNKFLGKAQIIRRPKVFVGPNFGRPKFFVGPNFRHHAKISSLMADIVWADKVDPLSLTGFHHSH